MQKTSFSFPVGEPVAEIPLIKLMTLLIPLAAEVEEKMELKGDEVLCWEALHCKLDRKRLFVCKVQLAKSNSFVVGHQGPQNLTIRTCDSIYVFEEGGYGEKPGVHYDTPEQLVPSIIKQLARYAN